MYDIPYTAADFADHPALAHLVAIPSEAPIVSNVIQYPGMTGRDYTPGDFAGHAKLAEIAARKAAKAAAPKPRGRGRPARVVPTTPCTVPFAAVAAAVRAVPVDDWPAAKERALQAGLAARLNATELAIYMFLVGEVRWGRGECFASLAQIVVGAVRSIRRVKIAVRSLEAHGLIAVHRHPDAARSKLANLYTIPSLAGLCNRNPVPGPELGAVNSTELGAVNSVQDHELGAIKYVTRCVLGPPLALVKEERKITNPTASGCRAPFVRFGGGAATRAARQLCGEADREFITQCRERVRDVALGPDRQRRAACNLREFEAFRRARG